MLSNVNELVCSCALPLLQRVNCIFKFDTHCDVKMMRATTFLVVFLGLLLLGVPAWAQEEEEETSPVFVGEVEFESCAILKESLLFHRFSDLVCVLDTNLCFETIDNLASFLSEVAIPLNEDEEVPEEGIEGDAPPSPLCAVDQLETDPTEEEMTAFEEREEEEEETADGNIFGGYYRPWPYYSRPRYGYGYGYRSGYHGGYRGYRSGRYH